MIMCKKCGTPNEESTKFCVNCGASLVKQYPRKYDTAKHKNPYTNIIKMILLFLGIFLAFFSAVFYSRRKREHNRD